MLTVGKTDEFENAYTEKFRSLVEPFGEVVKYEKDRAARDIGIHLKRQLESGKAQMASAVCWFQLKGRMKSSLSKEDLKGRSTIGQLLKVKHLQFWYLQPVPTYLGLYLECTNEFLILNLQDYVRRTWGPAVMKLDQEKVTVEVSLASKLDHQALGLLLRNSDIEAWAKALDTEDQETLHVCRRDYNLIWHLATAEERSVETRIEIVDWQSKMRGEIHFQERKLSSTDEWSSFRTHWERGLTANDVAARYPYLELAAFDDLSDNLWWESGDMQEFFAIELPNGEVIEGKSGDPNEVLFYSIRVCLNELGHLLLVSIKDLVDMGLLEISGDPSEFISIAPWESRDV